MERISVEEAIERGLVPDVALAGALDGEKRHHPPPSEDNPAQRAGGGCQGACRTTKLNHG